MEGIIAEIRELKDCLKVGMYERAFELAQNIDDEITTIELKKELVNASIQSQVLSSQEMQ